MATVAEAAAAEAAADVIINCHKGKSGYGIYFTQRPDGIFVTKTDEGSEAMKAGVRAGDQLVFVQCLEKRVQGGAMIVVSQSNYQEALEFVRQMSYCRLGFSAPLPPGF